MSQERKIVIIGGGPGGYVAAIRAAQLGAQVTLVEKEELGGTCLNVGCVPTKAILHAGELYQMMQQEAPVFGISASGIAVDWSAVMSRKDSIVSGLRTGVAWLLKKNKVAVLQGEGCLGRDKTVQVYTGDTLASTLSYDKLILATGSVPIIPPIPGVRENPDCIDSSAALSLDKVPKNLVVIGGGVIGIEFANAFANFGSKVTVFEMTDKILPMMDEQLSRTLRRTLEKQGIDIYTSTTVQGVDRSDGQTTVLAEVKGHQKSFPADKVLLAVGRRVQTEALNLNGLGIHHDKGRIRVNEHMQTNVADVYAIGDCLGQAMLAHVASAMGEVAAEHAMGHSAVYDGRTNASCVYTSPEFAGTGATETELKAQGINYQVGSFPLAGNAKAIISGGGQGSVKVLADKDSGVILGVHILGPRATDLIAEASLMIGVRTTVQDVMDTIHAHPTVSEAIREASMDVKGLAIHK